MRYEKPQQVPIKPMGRAKFTSLQLAKETLTLYLKKLQWIYYGVSYYVRYAGKMMKCKSF